MVSARTTMVGERWIMLTEAASLSQRSTQMSWAELLEPITTQRRPVMSSPPGWSPEWYCRPLKVSAPAMAGMLLPPERPVASTSWAGRSVRVWPSRSTSTSHSPLASSKRALLQTVELQTLSSMTLA